MKNIEFRVMEIVLSKGYKRKNVINISLKVEMDGTQRREYYIVTMEMISQILKSNDTCKQ